MTLQAPRLPTEIIEELTDQGRASIAARSVELNCIKMLDEVHTVLTTHNHLVPQTHISAAMKRLMEAKLRVTEDIRMCEEEVADNEDELAKLGGELIKAKAEIVVAQDQAKNLLQLYEAADARCKDLEKRLATEQAAVSDRDKQNAHYERIAGRLLDKINERDCTREWDMSEFLDEAQPQEVPG